MLPFLGAGLSYRNEIGADIERLAARVDFLELLTDQYMDMPPQQEQTARNLAARFPVVLHGVDLSIGTDRQLDEEYVRKVQTIVDWVRPKWVSDHLCFTRVEGLNIGQLTPLSFSENSVKVTVRNIKEMIEAVDVPFLVENISYYFLVPPSNMIEAEFITQVIRESGCWMLLDLANVQNNAVNNNYDAFEFLDQIPLDRVVQIHLAGGFYYKNLLLDTHSHAVPADVFEMLRYVAPRLPALGGVILERDQNYPPFEELLKELDQTRAILAEHWLPHYSSRLENRTNQSLVSSVATPPLTLESVRG